MAEAALGLIDLSSVAAGIEAADAMVKRAPIRVIRAGTVQPGRYLVLVGGGVADVEEALTAGREAGGGAVLDHVFLPRVHPEVVAAIRGGRTPGPEEALGVVETATVAAAIRVADGGVKGADVRLLEVRMADGLGGKGLVLFSGVVADVEAAVEIGLRGLERPALLVRRVVIPQLHEAMWENLAAASRFGPRVEDRS